MRAPVLLSTVAVIAACSNPSSERRSPETARDAAAVPPVPAKPALFGVAEVLDGRPGHCAYALTTDARHVYWRRCEETSGDQTCAVVRRRKDLTAETEVLVEGLGYGDQFAVDDRIFYASSPRILALDPGASAPRLIWEADEGNADWMHRAGDRLYWTSDPGSSEKPTALWTVPVAGGAPTLVRRADYLYITESGPRGLLFVAGKRRESARWWWLDESSSKPRDLGPAPDVEVVTLVERDIYSVNEFQQDGMCAIEVRRDLTRLETVVELPCAPFYDDAAIAVPTGLYPHQGAFYLRVAWQKEGFASYDQGLVRIEPRAGAPRVLFRTPYPGDDFASWDHLDESCGWPSGVVDGEELYLGLGKFVARFQL